MESHYTSIFNMMFEHKMSLTEVESLMPWEKEVFVAMLNERIKEANEAAQRNMG